MSTTKVPVMAQHSQRPAASRSMHDGNAQATPSKSLAWLRSLFSKRLVIRRQGFNVSIGFETRAAAFRSTEDPAAARRGEALRRDHETLRAWLDRHAESRLAMRHLAYVEQALARTGSRALRNTPPRVLREALEQLRSLAGDDAHTAFPELTQRLAQASSRPGRGRDEPDLSQDVDISEASLSLFDEMERSWTGRMPLYSPLRPDDESPPSAR